MTPPLTGLRVLDLSRALAGPFCSMMLGDMGAEIIKVEQPGIGDNTRAWGPPFEGGESSYFLSVNRNKRSIAIDMRQERGAEIVGRLIAHSDILLENFVPGTLDRLGFDQATCRSIQPQLISCSISGFGQHGPDRERTAFDQIAQGLGGIMSVTGDVGGPPTRIGIALADIIAGMFAAYAILVALVHRERTGEGQHVETSLLEGQLAMMTYQAASYLATGIAPVSYGNHHPSIVPYGVYRVADGYITLAVGNDSLWRRFCTALQLEYLQDDERFCTNPLRHINRDALHALLFPILERYSVSEIDRLLNAHSVPCGPVLDLKAAFANPQVAALDLVRTLQHPTAGDIRVVAPPYQLSATPPDIRMPPPLLGQHTDEILQSLGYDLQSIADLREAHVVA